ncbi:hypothetical protein AAHA92_20892 [Salvia divinorum]|uniref:Uncharacterized protein n=1 Tax=Salvia divinorum TaxID=28513 RepID=A0ABD1GLS1_SALDI
MNSNRNCESGLVTVLLPLEPGPVATLLASRPQPPSRSRTPSRGSRVLSSTRKKESEWFKHTVCESNHRSTCELLSISNSSQAR